MLPRISRYLLVILIVITLAYALPAMYNTMFDVRINMPNITYSEHKKDYFVMQNIDGKPAFLDRAKKVYSQQEFMNAAPIPYYHYHLSKGTLPDSFNGVKLVPQQLQKESIFQYVSPEMLSTPKYGLYPLFESQPEFGLRFPADVFRIGKRIAFIDAATNRVNEEKSNLYTAQLQQAGFKFPARLVSGIPSVMKRKDEGWFIVDNSRQLYHLKMVKGHPYVKNIPLPPGLAVKHIICNDFDSDEFYALLVSDSNRIYTLNKKDYSTTRFPVDTYDPRRQVMLLSGNLFTKTLTLAAEDAVRAYTVDRQYRKIDEYTLPLPRKSDMAVGKIAAFLFPFHVNLTSPYTDYVGMSLAKPAGYAWIYLNLLLLALCVILAKKEGRSIRRQVPDLLIVAFAGIFGFLAVHIAPNKQY